MSKYERARYGFGRETIAILVSAIFMTLAIYGYLPIDLLNPFVAFLQLLLIAVASTITIALLARFFFGQKPKKLVTVE